ncbi:transcription termination factor Rho [Haloglycomyces albus]|uniref:transcription termination factor Rho n=1 Tax=Haloglycomyces albus TaxID=526067 RepID=UPI00046D91F5|nr:transcription termination factor Rho [Haloglycomyces albus]
MLMPQLQQMASNMGITGVGRMRKSELITAIKAAEEAAQDAGGSAEQEALPVPDSDNPSTVDEKESSGVETAQRGRRRSARQTNAPEQEDNVSAASESEGSENQSSETASESVEQVRRGTRRRRRGNDSDSGGSAPQQSSTEQSEKSSDDDDNGRRRRRDFDNNRGNYRDRRKRRDRTDRDRRRGGYRDRNDDNRSNFGDDRRDQRNDDDLLPVAGILDILENYAFIRTTGYLAGSEDVYVSMAQVRRNKLRRGDAVTGAVKPHQENQGGKRREKYNPLVRLDSVNGMDPEEAKRRDEFYKLTPLYPDERLRLETEPNNLTGRVIDLVTPIGKGQRALIVSPPKAGKTMVMQSIANSITTNNPECHLMVVLVDERPEEVTDMQRSVKGEVISSTFDRPPSDHTTIAELSIERAKRLVELGHDVVVLLDGITRLARAYNNATPASGRIMSGGIDTTALYPPKKFLGAARNIEGGGSLTIVATALVETGSMGDTVIFEEFKGTGNSELKLDRKIAEKRRYPAVDVHASSTRKDDLMMSSDEQAVMLKLRRVLASLEPQQAIDQLFDRLKKTQTNAEFLMQIVKTTPGE